MTTPDSSPSDGYREVKYEYTPNLPEILQHAKSAVLITTYQAGKLLVLGVHDGKLQIAFSDYEQAMGLAVSPERVAIGSRRQIHFMVPAHELANSLEPRGTFDACFVPRTSFHTGSIHGHDLAWGEDGLWVVNTLFSCLCTLHDGYNFVPRWRPRFITQLIDQDRCHLNGLAMHHGQPSVVTALAETDEPAGWRPTKSTSGCVIDVASGETILRGLAMPHSPRWYGDRLWVLDSGNGRFGYVDTQRGRYETVETLPGYTRGLAFAGQFAFVGLSKIRETAIFGGVPIAESGQPLHCGVGVIDLLTGRNVAVFQFHSGVEEIFAIEVIPGKRNPLFAGGSVQQQEREVWIVPPEGMPRPSVGPVWPLYSKPRPTVPSDAGHPLPRTEAARRGPELLAQAREFQQAGQLHQAADCYLQAITLSTQPAPLWVDLGNLRQEQGQQEEALRCYQRALEADEQCIAALQNLGYLLFNRGQPEEATKCYDRLLQLDSSPINHLLSAAVLPVVYPTNESLHKWRKRVEKVFDMMVAKGMSVPADHSLIPTMFFLAYQGENDREIMAKRGQVIRGFDHLVTRGQGNGSPPAFPQAVAARRSPIRNASRQVRIGFLSAYFRDHTIGRLNIGRIERLRRDRFQVTVVQASRADDPMARRFMQCADRFLQLPRDVKTARTQLADLDLDILFYADVGMDALTSTLIFSRVAPIQCVTWGHPDTTGSPYADYFVSSRLLERDDAQEHYTEKLLRLPLLGTYYEWPRRSGPDRSRCDFGLSDDRHIYLCPQTLFKFHPDFDPILAGILQHDPRAQIVLLEGRVPEWTRRLQQRWDRTIPEAASRLRFLPAQPREDFLALLQLADVVIDPVHFGGGNSSYEALAMGTPVITWPGDYLRSRITYALYRKMQLPSLIADSKEAYVHLAVRAVSDPSFRHEIREQIRAQAPVLFEDPREVTVFEDCLLELAQQPI